MPDNTLFIAMSGETPIVNEVTPPPEAIAAALREEIETTSPETIVTIEKLVYGGEGLARPNGRVILTPFVLPGERVRIEMRAAPGTVHAGLAEVLEASAERVEPPCPLFRRCGGCHYQHAPYEFQLARKVEILREQLRRVGKIKWDGEIATISGPAFGYRNRAQFHIANGK